MPGERFDFVGSNGQQLAGRLDLPESPARATALFAHCFTCGKDIYAADRLAGALTSRSIGVLRFDFTGLGSSEGEFGNGGLTSNVEDLRAAARALREHGQAPRLLIGHSLGGAAVLAVAASIPEVRAIATIGAPFDAAHVLNLFKPQLPLIEQAGSAEVHLSGRPFRIDREFVEDVRRYSGAQHISELRKAILIMHSPTDAVVGIENAALIFQHAHHPKSFVSLDDSDHLLRRPRDADYVAGVIAAWVARYLERPPSGIS
jgi:alpha/beta superfamily hydrolase